MTIVARWESRGGKHWVTLHVQAGRYSYVGNGCGGLLGPMATESAAVAHLQARVDSGYFLPDDAVLPMKRVL